MACHFPPLLKGTQILWILVFFFFFPWFHYWVLSNVLRFSLLHSSTVIPKVKSMFLWKYSTSDVKPQTEIGSAIGRLLGTKIELFHLDTWRSSKNWISNKERINNFFSQQGIKNSVSNATIVPCSLLQYHWENLLKMMIIS